MTEVDLDGRVINPEYHDCVYTDEKRYTVCGRCIYRFTCKWIRYNLPNPRLKASEEQEK